MIPLCVFKILVHVFVCERASMWARVSHFAYVEVKDNLRYHSLFEAVFLLFTAVFSRLVGLLAPGDFPMPALLPTISAQEYWDFEYMLPLPASCGFFDTELRPSCMQADHYPH